MSWHAAHGNPDPFLKPAKVGEVNGPWETIADAGTHPHYGVQIKVRCSLCGAERVVVQTQLRHRWKRAKPDARVVKHRGCGKAAKR